jgi:hypothetical protein
MIEKLTEVWTSSKNMEILKKLNELIDELNRLVGIEKQKTEELFIGSSVVKQTRRRTR